MTKKLLALWAVCLTVVFAAKAADEVYTEFDASSGTLTYYYDDQRASRTGVTEVYDPVNNPNALRFVEYRSQVKTARIDRSMLNAHLTSTRSMFYGMTEIKEREVNNYCLYALEEIIDMEYLVTNEVTDMSLMFCGCLKLRELDLSRFNTANVTNMYGMFSDCSSLTELDLKKFDTGLVESMGFMFSGCSMLEELDLWHFNTANVTDMSYIFDDCKALTKLDVSKFNTTKADNMDGMFFGCSSLTELALVSFDVTSVRLMNEMFKNCTKLETILCDRDWNHEMLEVSEDMFKGCSALAGGKGTKYSEDNPNDITCARPDGGNDEPGYFTLPEKKVYTEFDERTGTLTYYYDDRYYHRDGKTEIYNPTGWANQIRFVDYHDRIKTARIDASMQRAGLTSTRDMFCGGNDTRENKEYFLSELTEITGMENLVTDKVIIMQRMFGFCSSLTRLDLRHLDMARVTNTAGMFYECSALKTILCGNDWSESTASSVNMFYGCTSLVGGNGTVCDGENNIDKTYARPNGGKKAPGYFTDTTPLDELEPLPTDEPTTFDFTLYNNDYPHTELLTVSLGAKDWYDDDEDCLVISSTNTKEEIDEKINEAFEGNLPLKSLLPGTIWFRLEAGKGVIEIDCKTYPGYDLKVRIAEYGTAYITSSFEQFMRGKATVTYDVKQDTYVAIYLDGTPSSAPARFATSEEDENAGAYIYGITVIPQTDPTGVEDVAGDSEGVRKVLINGNLYILRDGKVYTITGEVIIDN